MHSLRPLLLSALVSATSFVALPAFAQSEGGAPHAPVVAPARPATRSAAPRSRAASSPRNPRLDRLTQAHRQAGRGTQLRLDAKASEARGDGRAATQQHRQSGRRYEKAVSHFAAAGSDAEAASYAKHAANEYQLGNDGQGATRMNAAAEAAANRAGATETRRAQAPVTYFPTRTSQTNLDRLTAGSRLVGQGTSARLRAGELAKQGRATDAAASHDEAASYYDRAANEFRSGGDTGQADAYGRYATTERQAAAQARAAAR